MPKGIFQIYVGVPQNDKVVTVNETQTVTEILESENLNTAGLIQHNGATLNADKLNKTLKEVGFTKDDTLYVVKKLDNA